MRPALAALILFAGCTTSRPEPVSRIVATPTATPSPTPTPLPVVTATPSLPGKPVVTAAPQPVRTNPPRSAGAALGATRTVNSTAYCETGTMASGKRVYQGAVAMNGVPFGSRWLVHDGPMAGATLIVEDRIGHSSQFDVAMPGNCQAARNYGRRTVRVQRVG